MEKVSSNGMQIALDDLGDKAAPAVILIPGLGMPRWMWPESFLSTLVRAGYRLVSIDNSGNSIADIAMMCGFRDPLYFSKMFKKKYGMAPSHYCKAKRGPEDLSELTSDSVKVMLEDA